jgi:hypothetical protein
LQEQSLTRTKRPGASIANPAAVAPEFRYWPVIRLPSCTATLNPLCMMKFAPGILFA